MAFRYVNTTLLDAGSELSPSLLVSFDDTLLVDRAGSVITTSGPSIVNFGGRVINRGTIYGPEAGVVGNFDRDERLSLHNAEGGLIGGGHAINMAGLGVVVSNDGEVVGEGIGVLLRGRVQVATNSGTIRGADGAVSFGTYFSEPNGGDRLENSGTLVGGNFGVRADGAYTTLLNSGQIAASGANGLGVSFASRGTVLSNTGSVEGGNVAVSLGADGPDAPGHRVDNAGTMVGVNFGLRATGNAGGHVVSNTGLIAATDADGVGVALGAGGSTLTNTGTIEAGNIGVSFATGPAALQFNVLRNTGTIVGGAGSADYAILGGANRESVVNLGLIVGQVFLGAADDVFDGTGGRQSGFVFGDDGADVLLGGADADFMGGGAGDDSLVGGGGDDRLGGFDGNDTIVGGSGDDSLSGFAGDDSVVGGAGDDVFSGDAGADTLEGGEGRDFLSYAASSAVEVSLALGTGSGGDAAGDVFSGFEWLSGGNGADTLSGDAGDNRILGQNGADFLIGAAGNDTLLGGAGGDVLYGSTGADVLTGGLANDLFRYALASDSAGNVRDLITDFTAGDRIDLLRVDAVAGGGTANDTFAFIGAAAFSAAGQVRAEVVGTNTVVSVNTDANLATTEMAIVLRGAIVLAASDFIL